MLKKVILCPNPYRDAQLRVAREAKRVLDEAGCPNVVCLPFRNQEKIESFGLAIEPLQQELRGADLIVAFGGDGTILHLSKTAAHRDVPVLGVNLGSLGFMAELESKDLARLRDLCNGKYDVESRMMLDVNVLRDGRVIYSNLALNEALIARGNVSRVIRLKISTEQGKLVDIAGDGVIVASPTGSTAYSLSAGGPVVEPTARNFIVSPICAHSVHANAYVLSSERVITVQTEKNSYKPVLLSVDGGRAFSLRSGDCVEVRRSKFDTKLVRLTKRSFCEILQKKMLMGGLSNEELETGEDPCDHCRLGDRNAGAVDRQSASGGHFLHTGDDLPRYQAAASDQGADRQRYLPLCRVCPEGEAQPCRPLADDPAREHHFGRLRAESGAHQDDAGPWSRGGRGF